MKRPPKVHILQQNTVTFCGIRIYRMKIVTANNGPPPTCKRCIAARDKNS